jgi:hypothetical protein
MIGPGFSLGWRGDLRYAYFAIKTITQCMFLPPLALSSRGWGGRIAAILVCGLLACLGAVPTASAAEPDGAYKLVKATGSLSVGGKTMVIEAPVSGDLMGKALKGTIKATCKR